MNQRRPASSLKIASAILFIVLVMFACFAAMLYSFYQRTVEQELRNLHNLIATRPVPSELESSTALVSTRAELTAAQHELTKAHEQIASLQKQITSLQDKQDASDARISAFADQLQSASSSSTSKPATDVSSSTLTAATQVASVVPVASPVNQELWLLKERNRLTFYADQAIATGATEAMTNLWRSLEDPELAKLRDGVQAEIIRVQDYYSHLSRIPPEYRLPVRELFEAEPGIRSEADLKPAQIIKLLLDQKQPVPVRARAAFVLGGHRSDIAAKALIDCMRLDPVLDVVKEAQRTLELDYGMRVPPLHLKAASEWWETREKTKK